MKSLRLLPSLLLLWLAKAVETQPPASSFYVDLAHLPNFHKSPTLPPLHIWAGHLLAEKDNFIPPGPNETPHPNLPVQSHLYFVLVKARRAADKERTVFWFNGGPGCSSFDGLMMEVGPWRFDQDGELWETEGGWEEYTNMVYIDQPVGTGFSFGSTDKYMHELSDVPAQVIQFLKNFYEVFPELKDMDTYLAGESFAGQYIPYIASALLEPRNHLPINFAGIAIGNGWIDSRRQYPAYLDFAVEAGLFTANSEDYLRAKDALDTCQTNIDALAPSKNPVSIHSCERVMDAILQPFVRDEGNQRVCMNVYDLRLTDTYPQCGMNWPPDLKFITPWLRRSAVVNSLHANNKDTAWTECSGRVGAEMHNRESQSSVYLLPGILEKGVQVMIFAGDQDIICNYVGQERWLAEMTWLGAKGLGDAEVLDWSVNGTQAGEWTIARNVTYVKIYQASHMVGFDVPHVSHDMMLRFMGVDFSQISDGTVGKIDSTLGEGKEDGNSAVNRPGGGKLAEAELKAKWEAYYNAGTVALIVVLSAVAVGTFLFCRSRRKAGPSSYLPSRISLRPSRDEGYMSNGHGDEQIPLTSNIGDSTNDLSGEEEGRRRKGKGRAVHFDDPEGKHGTLGVREETVFAIGDDDEAYTPRTPKDR